MACPSPRGQGWGTCLLPPPLGEGWGGGVSNAHGGGPSAPIPAFPQRGKEEQPPLEKDGLLLRVFRFPLFGVALHPPFFRVRRRGGGLGIRGLGRSGRGRRRRRGVPVHSRSPGRSGRVGDASRSWRA